MTGDCRDVELLTNIHHLLNNILDCRYIEWYIYAYLFLNIIWMCVQNIDYIFWPRMQCIIFIYLEYYFTSTTRINNVVQVCLTSKINNSLTCLCGRIVSLIIKKYKNAINKFQEQFTQRFRTLKSDGTSVGECEDKINLRSGVTRHLPQLAEFYILFFKLCLRPLL